MSPRKGRRNRPAIHRRTQPGASPGTIAPDPSAKQSAIQVFAYGPDHFQERPIKSLDELVPLLDVHSVVWINVDGLGDQNLIEQLGVMFGLHRLALEDVVNTHQRAKVEAYGEVLFIVARMADMQRRSNTEQLSMFVGRNFVITLQEEAGDCWNPVRNRIRNQVTRLFNAGPDYLAYALIDAVIDAYFPLLEQIGEELDALDEVAATGRGMAMARIHVLHSELLFLRRAIRPHREAIAELARETTPVFTEQTKVYLRDCYDHVIQITDLTETYREMTTDLRELYLSAVGLRTNEIMRVLTVITTIFMPLTFIAGIYGMNFDHMPELHWRWGYAWALLLMGITMVLMLYFFRRRGWMESNGQDHDVR
jgi:magnesium transporter